MLLGQRLDSLPGVAVAQILGLRARLASPRAALPPLTPPVGHPLACRQAPPRVRGSRPRILSTAVGCAAQGAWPPHRRPCPLWPPRRMPHGPVRRFWPRAPFGLRGLMIPWRASGCALAAGRPAGPKKTRRPAGAGSVASAGRRGRADPVCARKACRRVPAPGRAGQDRGGGPGASRAAVSGYHSLAARRQLGGGVLAVVPVAHGADHRFCGACGPAGAVR